MLAAWQLADSLLDCTGTAWASRKRASICWHSTYAAARQRADRSGCNLGQVCRIKCIATLALKVANRQLTLFFCLVQVPLSGDLRAAAEKARTELIERVADADEQLGEQFLMEQPISPGDLQDAIRRATIALKFVPIFMGRCADRFCIGPLAASSFMEQSWTGLHDCLGL